MYTKFYDNTIITKFVKELVSKTNVPFISTWKPGDFAIRGMLYLTRDAIWKCQHTGWPENINATCPKSHISTQSGSYNLDELRFFKRVSTYVFGEEYYNITGRYESKILGYDNITHFYLGQYLRMMRDIYDLDMMPFYNCFGNEYLADIDFNQRGEVFSASSQNNSYKILSVPVRFGQQYMIAINSEVPIECICAIYGSKGFIKELTENLNTVNSAEDEDGKRHNTYKKFQRTQFQSPVLYRTVSWHQLYQNLHKDDNETINNKAYDQGLGQFERYLRLLIKIPKSNKSSVVVIEGDYPVVSTFESPNTSSVTWSNQYLYGTSVNSKTVTGDWIRPEVIQNFSNNFSHAANYFPRKSYKVKYRLTDNNLKKCFSGELITSPLDSTSSTFEGRVKFEIMNKHINNHYQIITDLQRSNIVVDQVLECVEYEVAKPNKEPLLSPLGLLQVSDGNIYAFSDRLIEYLVQNVINHLDEFSKDVERVQKYSKSEMNWLKNASRYSGEIVTGVWDKDFQEYLFKLVKDSSILGRHIDLTGYVDKDTETIITRGQKV